MNIIGIIAEYNPLHLGHLYQIKKAKEMYPNSIIILITNSYFSQRGEVNIINKWDKARLALDNNIDLIIELPFVYATQGADIFAKGALKILNTLKIDTLIFGSESNNIEKLKEIAKTQLYNKEYNKLVKIYLDKGINYPTALSKALEDKRINQGYYNVVLKKYCKYGFSHLSPEKRRKEKERNQAKENREKHPQIIYTPMGNDKRRKYTKS